MKKMMVRGIAIGSIALMAIACNKKEETVVVAPASVDKEQIKTDLQVMETAFADAYNNKKAEGVTYYSDDATSYGQNKPPQVGREAIDKGVKEDITGFPKGNKISFTVNEVFPSNDGNQVVELGSYKVVDSTNASKSSGNYFSLFEKRDGKYVCIRDMAASDMPMAKK